MCEKFAAPFTSIVQTAPDYRTVAARYLYERANFGMIGHSVPLFLVNGNHEGEAGWLLDGTSDNIAIWATNARKTYFPVPQPDSFYSSSEVDEPIVGKRDSWYSWTWGDVQFIVLDPFWYTTVKSKRDAWVWTLGQEQYQWLVHTLQGGTARFRFVFVHNLLGGVDADARGGVEGAPFFEWGGKNIDGTNGFDAKRPGWGKPIHQLFVDNHVTAVLHGHDHFYDRQELDAIVYQEVPQPSAFNFNNGPNIAAEAQYTSGLTLSSSGHMRFTVNPNSIRVDYVRAYRLKDENRQRHNGDISDTYALLPR